MTESPFHSNTMYFFGRKISFIWRQARTVRWGAGLTKRGSCLTLSGPGGAQRPGWPKSQLPIRNILTYDAQTWWILVFILKTPFGQILAKLVSQGGGLLLLFSHRDVPKILKMKNFSSAWKLLKLTWWINFGSRRTIMYIKTHFLNVKPVFQG